MTSLKSITIFGGNVIENEIKCIFQPNNITGFKQNQKLEKSM